MDTQIEEKVSELEAQITEIKLKVAEVRPVQDLVRLLLYFWAAVSVVLGVLGWKQLSDVEEMVAKQVQLTLPADKARFAEYGRLIDETKQLYTDFEMLTATYKERVQDLDYAETVSKDFDIEGKMENVIRDVDVGDNAKDPAWRTKAIFQIRSFRDSVIKSGSSADLIFNVAQTCRQLNQILLMRELTEAAYNTDPSPPVKAMYLASQIASLQGDEREARFAELMRMVEDLPTNSPQIVLAEAWNAAEDQRRYVEFERALEELIRTRGAKSEANGYVPSYAYVILARTRLRQGTPDALVKARQTVEEAALRLSSESPLAQWSDASSRDLEGVLQVLLATDG